MKAAMARSPFCWQTEHQSALLITAITFDSDCAIAETETSKISTKLAKIDFVVFIFLLFN
jgi:hypothetical protein